jgi:transcriptional regulator with XRE-family HTH domain
MPTRDPAHLVALGQQRQEDAASRRALLGLSQPQVADAAGVSTTMTLKRAEGSGKAARGLINMSLAELSAAAAVPAALIWAYEAEIGTSSAADLAADAATGATLEHIPNPVHADLQPVAVAPTAPQLRGRLPPRGAPAKLPPAKPEPEA